MCAEEKAEFIVTLVFSLFLYLEVSVQDSHKAAAHATLLFLPFVHSQSL